MNHLKLKSTQLTKCPCSQDLKSGYQNVLKGLLKRTIYKETFGFSLKCGHLQDTQLHVAEHLVLTQLGVQYVVIA